MDELTLIARAGMWGLYRNQKGWHVEGYDKRNGREYVFSFVRVELDRFLLSDTYLQYVIYGLPRRAVSKKAYARFMAIMQRYAIEQAARDEQARRERLAADYRGNYDWLKEQGAL